MLDGEACVSHCCSQRFRKAREEGENDVYGVGIEFEMGGTHEVLNKVENGYIQKYLQIGVHTPVSNFHIYFLAQVAKKPKTTSQQ